jgi:hypothetical protein
MKMTTNR